MLNGNAEFDPMASPGLEIEPVALQTTVAGGTHQERTAVLDALDRFSALPKELPPLDIKIPGESGCLGHSGLFRTGTDRRQIELCEVTMWVILHEMGHGWTALHLTQQQRLQFTKHWGLETWNDAGTTWRVRGAEDAADTIAWGLLEERVGCHLPDGPITHRLQAFRQLTGVDSKRVQCADPPEPEQSVSGHFSERVDSDTQGIVDDVYLDHLVNGVRQVARGIDGTDPDRSLRITFVDQVGDNRYTSGRAGAEGNIEIRNSLTVGMATTIIHEVAHVLDPSQGHGEVWCEVFLASVAELVPARLEGVQTQVSLAYPECEFEQVGS